MQVNPTIDEVMIEISQWGDATFGAHYRAEGIMNHIREELGKELKKQPYDMEEVADLVVLMSNVVGQNWCIHCEPTLCNLSKPPHRLDNRVLWLGKKWMEEQDSIRYRFNKWSGYAISQMFKVLDQLKHKPTSNKLWLEFLDWVCRYAFLIQWHWPDITPAPLLSIVLRDKMEKNYKREWQKPDEDGVVRHVKGVHD